MKKLIVLSIVLITCVLAGLGLMLITQSNPPTNNSNSAIPGKVVITWLNNDNQSSAENVNGEFKIRGYMAASNSILFFYSLQSSKVTQLQFSATSHQVLNSGPGFTTPLKIKRVQTIGKLGSFDTGIVEIEPVNKIGQVIFLEAAPVGQASSVWQVSPLKQIGEMSKNEEINYHSVQARPSAINLKFGSGDNNNYTSLELSLPNNISAMYLKLDKNLTAIPITAAEHKRMNPALSLNKPAANTNSSQNGYEATIAPTRAL